MKSKLYTLLTVFALLVFLSCEKTVSFDDTYKNDNEAAFAKIAANSEYKKIESESNNGFIMYKELAAGDKESQSPYYTSKVKVSYKGWYKKFWTKGDTFVGDDGGVFHNKVNFDASPEGIAREFAVNGVVDGFSTALQYMKVGDKWEVWIPWQLGYGASPNSQTGIQPYQTLVFELELVSISN